MKGDNTNQGNRIVWSVSVMAIATYLSSDSTIVKGLDNFCCENGILPPKILVLINCNLLRFCMERRETSRVNLGKYCIHWRSWEVFDVVV